MCFGQQQPQRRLDFVIWFRLKHLSHSSVFPSTGISPHASCRSSLLYEAHSNGSGLVHFRENNFLTSTRTGTCVQLDQNPPSFYHAASAAHITITDVSDPTHSDEV